MRAEHGGDDRVSSRTVLPMIDYWLNHPEVRMSPDQAESYWRERVRLMNSLLNLRRAQAQRMAFDHLKTGLTSLTRAWVLSCRRPGV